MELINKERDDEYRNDIAIYAFYIFKRVLIECGTSMAELFSNNSSRQKAIANFAKKSVIYVWVVSKYTFE